MNFKLKYEKSVGQANVRLPLSKSIALRAAIISIIHYGRICVEEGPDFDDWKYLVKALNDYFDLPELKEDTEFYLGDGAAPLRFFLAYAASRHNFVGTITCSPSLKKRPLKPLIEALRDAGATIECLEREGYPPLRVKGVKINGISEAVGGEVSSQFISALMMASLLWRKRYEVPEGATLVSSPYVEMTRKMIRMYDRFNHRHRLEEPRPILVYDIESDWTAASYFYELVLANPSITVSIGKLKRPSQSLQGDSACAKIFDDIGIKTEFLESGSAKIYADLSRLNDLTSSGTLINLNLRETPDLVPAITVGLCLAGIQFYIDGIGHLRHKESDRLEALTRELAKAGYMLEKSDESLAWRGKRLEREGAVCFDSHNDHRIAMSLAISAVKLGEIEIRNAECVSKSFPKFYDEIAKFGIILTSDS